MILSVIVLTHNRINALKKTLDSIFNQKMNFSHEIIVVDDASNDGTNDYIMNHPKINQKIILDINLGPSNGRNVGFSNSKGELLVFMDADITFKDDLQISRIVKLYENQENFTILSPTILDINENEFESMLIPQEKIGILKSLTFREGFFVTARKYFESRIFNMNYYFGNEGLFLSLELFSQKKYVGIVQSEIVMHDHPRNFKGRNMLYLQSSLHLKRSLYPIFFHPIIFLFHTLRAIRHLKFDFFNILKSFNSKTTKTIHKLSISQVFYLINNYGLLKIL